MTKKDYARIQDVSAALRKRAFFFKESEPTDLSPEDFQTIGDYLQNLADTLDASIKHKDDKSVLRGLVSFVFYIALMGGLCYFFYQYSPYEDRYYLKLAKEVFSEANADNYVFYIRSGIAVFCALFVFFISVFISIIACGIVKLMIPRFVNAITEAVVSILLSGVCFYLYYEHIFTTGLAKSFLQ